MEISKFNHWLQISANIGIVAGLLLVGIQLKQNSDLLKTQLLYEESNRAIEMETQVIGENAARVWAKSLTEPQNLTLEEQRIMEALLWIYAEHLRATRLLATLGLLDDDEWRLRVRADSGFFYGNRYAAAWWKNYKAGNEVVPQDLIDAVDARLADVSVDNTLEYFGRQLEYLDLTPADESPADPE